MEQILGVPQVKPKEKIKTPRIKLAEQVDEIDVTTTNITADKVSIFIDQLTFRDPELIQVAIIILSSYWFWITSYKTIAEKTADIETKKLVKISQFLSPINFPKKPDIIEAIKGNAIIDISILTF